MGDRSRSVVHGDYMHEYEESEGATFWDGKKETRSPHGQQVWEDEDVNYDEKKTDSLEMFLCRVDQFNKEIKENIQGQRDNLKILTNEKRVLVRQIKELEKEYKETERKHVLQMQKLESELKKENLRLQQKNDEYNKLKEEAMEIINKLKKDNSELKRRGIEKGEDLSLQQKIDEKNKEIQRLHAECDELKTRKPTRDNLFDGHSNIADLSDTNRPTKLGERFCELYDNQWTDAMEVIISKFSEITDPNEEESISILLDILMACKQFCDAETRQQDNEIIEAFFRTRKTSVRFPEEMSKQLKDFKKCSAPYSAEYVLEKYLKQARGQTYIIRYVHYVPEYVRECITICWLMVQHDPPLEIGPTAKHGDEFNKKLYKEFTSSGTEVDFVVWPPLLLHANGPILAKGVAQGMRRPSMVLKKPTEAFPEKRAPTFPLKHAEDAKTCMFPIHQNQIKRDKQSDGYVQETDHYRKYIKSTPTRKQYEEYLYYMKKYGSQIAKQMLGIRVFTICTDYDQLNRP